MNLLSFPLAFSPFFSSLFLSFFRLFCFAVFFPLSPSFYLFFAFSSLSLSSLSFAFPSFFQITAGSLLFASGFSLFCFSLPFFFFCLRFTPFDL